MLVETLEPLRTTRGNTQNCMIRESVTIPESVEVVRERRGCLARAGERVRRLILNGCKIERLKDFKTRSFRTERVKVRKMDRSFNPGPLD